MATAENAKLQYEAGQSVTAMTALTTSDGVNYTSGASLWSRRSGFAPVVRPNGLLTGGAVTPNASNNVVNVAALTLNLNGTATSVSAGTLTASRGSGSDTHRITSLTVNSSGALAAVAGTAGTAFSETRGAAGGPPLIPVDSVEIGQVRLSSISAAAVTAGEIFTVVGLHVERADFPAYTINYASGSVVFVDTNPSIHTGPAPKKTFASYAGPIFGDVPKASDFVPPENTYAVSSSQIYGQTLGSTTATLGQGGFTCYLEDGVNDAIVAQKGQNLWFKFFPDRYKSSYLLCQGVLGLGRTFPAGDQIQAACTISAESIGSEVA